MLAVNVLLSLVFLKVADAYAEQSCLLQYRNSKGHADSDIPEALRRSDELGNLFLLAADQKSVSDETTALLKSFRPCAECKQHRRYGESNDGGYVMCDDDIKLGQLKGAYSYGINGFDGWANDVSAEFKIPVFEYDCTNPKVPAKCPTCDLRFNLECINGNSAPAKENYGTLSQHFQKNGHSGAAVAQASLLLKIDVEGAEWPVFAEEPRENLKKFREIIVEFHDLDQVGRHPLFLKAVSNILGAGFVVEHIHGNNNGGQARIGEQIVPKVLEVTYIQRTNSSPKCLNHAVTVPEDAINNKNMPDLPPATLPMMS